MPILSGLLSIWVALTLTVPSAVNARKQSVVDFFVYIGSSKSERTASKGIYVYRFNAGSGQISSAGLAPVSNPAFLAVSPDLRFLYTVNQNPDYDTSAVTAFAINRTIGMLTQINQMSSRGANPVCTELDRRDKYVLVANCIGGTVAAFWLRDDGGVGESTAFVQYTGEKSPNHPERPPGSYPHSINASPDNRFALVTALGLDRLYVYAFDQEHGTLAQHDPPFVDLRSGAGPRHIAFDPTGKYVYVLDETAGAVTVFSYSASEAALRQLQTISTLPKDFKGDNQSAEVEVHPSGQFLFASNRGHDGIAVFAIERAKGTLVLIETVASYGSRPGNFQIDPTGSYLFVANEQSNNVVIFTIDRKTGRLTQTGHVLDVPCPQNIVFVVAK